MKLVELWQERTRPTISFEVFPARTPKGEGKLSKVLNKLSALEPDFFAVTSGAGGSTRSGSLALARQLKETLDQEVLAYFNGYGQGPPGVEAALSEVALDLVAPVAERRVRHPQLRVTTAGKPEGAQRGQGRDTSLQPRHGAYRIGNHLGSHRFAAARNSRTYSAA